MFQSSIELINPLNCNNGNFSYYVLSKNSFDPGLKVGDRFEITNWDIWNKSYTLKTMVVSRKLEFYLPDNKLVKEYGFPSQVAKEGAILLRIFVELEDRDKLLELHEVIKQNSKVA